MLSASNLLPFLSLLSLGSAATTVVGGTYKSPTTPSPGVILASGTSYVTGTITSNLLYDASGKIAAGGCGTIAGVTPSSCYIMSLTATGEIETKARARRSVALNNSTIPTTDFTHFSRPSWSSASHNLTLEEKAALNGDDLDAYFEAFPEQAVHRWNTTGGKDPRKEKRTGTISARAAATSQRNEIYSWPGAAAGEKWEYTWTTLQRRLPATSAHFFHTWQILRRDASGGPVITLDWKVGEAVITDAVAGCTGCVAVPINPFINTPVYHSLNITYGPSGTISYNAASASSSSLISYSATHDMGSSGSLKMGAYRLTESTNNAVENLLMDYVGHRVA